VNPYYSYLIPALPAALLWLHAKHPLHVFTY